MRIMSAPSGCGLALALLTAFASSSPAQRQGQALDATGLPSQIPPLSKVLPVPGLPAVFVLPTALSLSGRPVPSLLFLDPTTLGGRTMGGAHTDIVVVPREQDGCPGGVASFGVIAAPAGSTYVWRKDGSPIVPAETGSTLTLGPLAAADAGNYDVVVTFGNTTLVSHDGVLTIADPLVITQHPQDEIVRGSEPATFSVAASGPGPITFQWRFRPQIPQGSPFEDIPGATGPQLVIQDPDESNLGAYRCAVGNSCGTVLSKVARLTLL